MVRGTIKLSKPVYNIELDFDKDSLEANGFVRVIRCKDCKFHHDRTQCKKRIGAWFDDDYCNGAVRAERKDNGQNG